MVNMYLVFKETAKLFSRWLYRFKLYIPTSNVSIIQFLCIFINVWYHHYIFYFNCCNRWVVISNDGLNLHYPNGQGSEYFSFAYLPSIYRLQGNSSSYILLMRYLEKILTVEIIQTHTHTWKQKYWWVKQCQICILIMGNQQIMT